MKTPYSVFVVLVGLGFLSSALTQAQEGPVLITESITIAADNIAYEGVLLEVQGCTLTVEGDHGFAHLTVVANGEVQFAGTNLAVGGLELRDTSRFQLAGGATLQATNDVQLLDTSSFWVLGKDAGAQIDGAWRGVGGQIRAADLTVAAGARLTADQQGYGGSAGPGAGLAVDSGAGHGGRGGSRGTPGGGTYGSASEPVDLGSGGVGSGMWGTWSDPGIGGGAIRVAVSGTLTLDGAISANGGDAILHIAPACCAWGSGGAGGSLWIQAGSLVGNGQLQAKGGRGSGEGTAGAGGGGGRVAIYCDNAEEVIGRGLVAVQGGQGVGNAAQVGTVSYWNTQLGAGRYTLLLPGTRFDWPGGQTLQIEHLRAWQQAEIAAGPDAEFELAGNCSLESGSTMTLGGGSRLAVGGTLNLGDSNCTLLMGGKNTGGMVDGAWAGAGGTIEAGSLTVAAGTRITADAQGYTEGAGPGAGGNPGVGGGHGGQGGGSSGGGGGVTYDSVNQPAQPGSGGRGSARWGTWASGGSGGGALRIRVAGELALEGTISADGGNATSVAAGDCCASGSGGAGGSIWIEAGTLRGSGAVRANGGQGAAGGADGGGGRLAIYIATDAGFAGIAASTALGGRGSSNPGQNGTVGFWNTALGPGRFALWVPADRFDWPAGLTLKLESLRLGATAERPARFELSPAGRLEATSVSVTGGSEWVCGADAQVQLTGNATLQDASRMTLGGGGVLAVGGTLTLADSNCVLVVESKDNAAAIDGRWVGESGRIQAGDLTVAAGAEITASAQGYVAGAGPGAADGTGVGGGHGGQGGGSNGSNSGLTYGSAWEPEDLGSGGRGSARWGTWATGGNGGGALRISVAGVLTLEGNIVADGGRAVMVAAGDCCAPGSGGAGGSIWVDTDTLRGAGAFRAEGGRGDAGGASGGGGRVAVYSRNLADYTGIPGCSVRGAGPDIPGQPGTLGFVDVSQGMDQPRLLVPRERFTCPAGATLRLGALTIGWPGASNAVFEMGENVTFQAQDLTVQQGALMNVGGGSVFDLTGTLRVQDSNSVLLVQGRDAWGMVSNAWVGVGSTLRASNIVLSVGAKISADAQGYGYSWNAPANGPGAPPRTGAGAGHGGTTPDGGLAYGAAFAPTDLGSGGSGSEGWSNGTRGGSGGGAIHLVATGDVIVDGEITADGETAVNYPSPWGCCAAGGGGAGGSVFIEARNLQGAGSVSANGGPGIYGSSGGAGGRLAVWTWGANGFPTVNLYALAGEGTQASDNGTVRIESAPFLSWNPMPNPYAHGGQVLSWAAVGLDVTQVQADVTVYREGLTYPVARGLRNFDRALWDTTLVPDGRYEAKVVFRNLADEVVGELAASVFVNNAAPWHGGELATSATWSKDTVHLIERDLLIGSGVTLTLEPGAVVKVLPGRRIVIATGGRLDAPGTEAAPIVFTVLEDDTAGGDTNFDGDQSRPQPGSWPGLIVSGGTADLSPFVVIRYPRTAHSGTLAANETWLGSALHDVVGDVIVPPGLELTIEPGAVVKFAANRNLRVGGTLNALGTSAQPIVITSARDDTSAGDTNGDGDSTRPSAGDWGAIEIGGEANLAHVRLTYGGGTAGGGYEWGAGTIRTGAGAVLRLGESVLSQSAFEGIHATGGGDITVSNTVIMFTDRAINGDGAVARLLNCTLYKNRIGLWPHNGVIQARNCIISHSIETGVYADNDVQFCNVWSPTGDNGNFTPGASGNTSADPRFKNAEAGDFRLDYRSPCIDAADGAVAPGTDAMGAPRYADPRTLVKSGTPTPTGAYADLGAFEFVEEAESPVDLVVTRVQGPAQAMAGDEVTVQWVVANRGTAPAQGPWHDGIRLAPVHGTGTDAFEVAEAIRAAGITLGPGQSCTNHAEVRVPGGAAGDYRWQVLANQREDVFEGRNLGNNLGVADALTALDVPRLDVSQPMVRQFTSEERTFWYKIVSSATQDLLVSLDLARPDGRTALYAGRGYMPTPQHFDRTQTQWDSADTSVLFPAGPNQTYYLLVTATQLPADSDFSLQVHPLDFSVTAVHPNTAGDVGPVTLRIEGGQLREDYGYSLVPTIGPRRLATAAYPVDSSVVYATFELRDLLPGVYALRVEHQGSARVLPDALTVTHGGQPGRVQTRVLPPAVFRAGMPAPVIVEYFNDGDADAVAPLVVFSAREATVAWSPDAEEYQRGATDQVSAIAFLAISPEGPAGVLPPGAQGQVNFDVTPTVAAGSLGLSCVQLDPSDSINWSARTASLRPMFIPEDAWEVVFANFIRRNGTTAAEHVARLAEDATYLGRLGTRTHETRRLLNFELWLAGARNQIGHRYALGPFGRGWAGPANASAQTDARGNVWIGSVDGSWLFLRQSDGSYLAAPGNSATLQRQGGFLELRLKDGTRISFGADGQMVAASDATANHIGFVYDGARLVEVNNSRGDRLSLTYDGNGRVVRTLDAVGRVTTYDYDASGEHLLRMRQPQGVTEYSYVSNAGAAREHALASIAYPDGTHEAFEYDDWGRLVRRARDQDTRVRTFGYERGGSVVFTNEFGGVARLCDTELTELNEVIRPDGARWLREYDRQGRLVRAQAPDGGITAYAYDDRGNLTGSANPLGAVINLTYSPDFNRLTGLRFPSGASVQTDYDARGNRVRVTYPDGTFQSFERNARGQPTRWVNRRQAALDLLYNAQGHLAGQQVSGELRAQFTYDPHRNLASISNHTGVVTYEYNDADRLLRITNSAGPRIEFAYDNWGRRTSWTDRDGFTVRYAYDAAGRLHRLTDGTDTTLAAYDYDSSGALRRVTYGNHTASTYAYDRLGRALQIRHLAPDESVLDRSDYEYDAVGRLVTTTTTGGRWRYAYDPAGQLVRAEFDSTSPGLTDRTYEYAYDQNGNRVRTATDATRTDYVGNPLDEYLAVGNDRLSYDADGNLLSRVQGGSTWTDTYDQLGQLVRVSSAGGTWEYAYDALGRRIETTRDGQLTRFLIDPSGLGNVVAEHDATGQVRARYVHGLGMVARLEASGAAAFYHADVTGNIVAVTDGAGAVSHRYAYGPFGEELVAEESADNPYTYVGAWGVRREGNGLYFMRARYYSPALGRFTALDPSGQVLPNGYAYAANEPVSRVDPTGLGWENGVYIPNYDTPDIIADVGGGGIFEVFGDTIGGIGGGIFGLGTTLIGGAQSGTIGLIAVIHHNNQLGEILDYNAYDKPPDWEEHPTQFSKDPNQIVGPAGFGELRWIDGRQVLLYTIQFENDPQAATLPAQTVAITHLLSADLDWSSFRLTGFNLGGRDYPVPSGLQDYTTRLDLRPSCGLFVDLAAGLDPASGRVQWQFRSIDPRTGRATRDPIAGFLPPNTNAPAGEGWVRFSVEPKTNRVTDTRLIAQARIVFDVNDPIDTESHTNRVDATPPGSALDAYPTDNPRVVALSIGASDPQSGLAGFDLYLSREGAPFQLWAEGVTDREFQFTGEPGVEYRFFSLAHDAVGNSEPMKSVWDSVVTLDFRLLPLAAEAGDPPRLRLRWESSAGLKYVIQRTSDLEQQPFTDIAGPLEATPLLNTFADDLDLAETRYYRVLKSP